MSLSIRYSLLDSRKIVNLNDPSSIWKVSRHIEDWWDSKYDPLRVEIRKWYIEAFDRISGHYKKLRISIEKEGFLNPIVITSGIPKYRKLDYIPPQYHNDLENLLSVETCGGSRLLIAQEKNLMIPCFINDWNNRFSDKKLMENINEIRSYLSDKKMSINITRRGLEIPPRTFEHMNDTNYNMSKQKECRGKVLYEIVNKSDKWLKENLKGNDRLQLEGAIN